MNILVLLKIVFLSLLSQNILIVGDSEACAMKFGAITAVRQPGEMVFNICKNGTRVAYWEGEKMRNALSTGKYDTVIVFLGTNDYGSKPDPTKIVSQIKATGASCVWVGPTLVRGKKSVTNDHLRTRVSPCVYLDTQALGVPLVDGIHPTSSGAVKWLTEVWRLKNLLRKQSKPKPVTSGVSP